MISDSVRRSWGVILLIVTFLAGCTGAGEVVPSVQAAGRPESSNTRLLATGSTLLQRDVPPGALNIYLVGFHPLKDNPFQQMEAHHFCCQVNEDFMQCALFDGNTPDANLNGIKYIISERLFETLPQEERHLHLREARI